MALGGFGLVWVFLKSCVSFFFFWGGGRVLKDEEWISNVLSSIQESILCLLF